MYKNRENKKSSAEQQAVQYNVRELRREFEHHGMEAVRGCEFVVANSQIMNYMQKKKGERSRRDSREDPFGRNQLDGDWTSNVRGGLLRERHRLDVKCAERFVEGAK